MKKQRKTVSLKIVMLVLGFSGLGFGIYWGLGFPKEKQTARQIITAEKQVKQKLNKLKVSQNTLNRAKILLQKPPAETEEARRAMQYLEMNMKDQNFSRFFHYTLEFFGQTSAGFAAARFVSVSMLFDNSPEKRYLMEWTTQELKKNSKILFDILLEKQAEISINPYFHNRMLNLVNQLDLPQKVKVNFYGFSINQPLKIGKTGALEEDSLPLEIALVLAKDNVKDGFEIRGIIENALLANQEPNQKMALQNRVLAFFPELKPIFASTSQ